MTYAKNFSARNHVVPMPDGRRNPKKRNECWICGKDCQGRYCPPHSTDVTEARVAHRNSLIKKNKNK